MCLSVLQLCSFQCSGASGLCPREKACPSLVTTLPLPPTTATGTCRCVCQRGLSLACAHQPVSEIALPLLTPVEERAVPGNVGCHAPWPLAV